MDFMQSVQTVLKNYAKFEGRSGRAEYWWWFLAFLIAYAAATIVGKAMGMGDLLASLLALGVLLPNVAVSVRRWHDIGKSGWWTLLLVIPFVNLIVMLIFLTKVSEGPNQYGEGPQGPAA